MTDGEIRIDDAIGDLIEQHQIAVESLTQKQLASAIKQAIQCGDFQRFILASEDKQAVVYLPFQREAELRARIAELENELRLRDEVTKWRLE